VAPSSLARLLLADLNVHAIECATGGPSSSVVLVHDRAGLASHLGEWEELVRAALEPNVFYEPWMLLPALDAFGVGKILLFVLVYVSDPRFPDRSPVLAGLFPLERQRRYRGLPLQVVGLWRYLHCFLCTPLLRADRAREALLAFLEWTRTSAEVGGLLELGTVAGEGVFHQLLLDDLNESRPFAYSTSHTRALFLPAASANAYLAGAISGKKRKDLRRLQNRLADQGPVRYEELQPDGDVEEWLRRFLEIEGSGWKGREGSAFSAHEENRRFFTEIIRGAFRRRRLMMLALRQGDRTVAMKCNLLGGAGSFAFKIAYDENYARFSPGVLLELENIRRLHGRPEILWMDSCASPGHAMIEGLWRDRRTIQTLVVSSGTAAGGLVVSALPLLKWLRRQLFPDPGPLPSRMPVGGGNGKAA
jgi:hypothetical protein